MRFTLASAGLALALHASSQAQTLPQVIVEGCGRNEALAQAQAFRKAVEFHSGSVVVNDSELTPHGELKQQSLDYSAGRVVKYNIVATGRQAGQVCVTAEVWVESSRVAHRILSHERSQGDFSGAQHAGQLASVVDENQRGDRLLGHVLQDYPARAYNIQTGTYNLKVDSNRQTVLEVPYTIKWNANYLKAIEDLFNSVLTPLTWKNISSQPTMTVTLSHPTDKLFGDKLTWLVHDDPRAQVIHQAFANEPRIQLNLIDRVGKKVLEQCWRLASVHDRGFIVNNKYSLRLYGNYTERNSLKLVLPSGISQQIGLIDKIQLAVVSDRSCK